MDETGRVRLWLLRHAKSSWDRPGLEDRERPLSRRGAHAAALLRGFIDAEGIHPDLVLCSSALRTRETLAGILPALGPVLDIRVEDSIYTFAGDVLLDRIRAIPTEVGAAMVIGHNPAMQELALSLASRGEPLSDLAEKLPTGALAEIRFAEGTWSDLGDGNGELTRFVTPRELEAADRLTRGSASRPSGTRR